MTPKEYSGAFRSWLWMMKRCCDPLDELYARYGGAGKGVCDRWMRFDAFLGDMGGRPDGLSLDRIDNARGYEPGNCRWATSGTQSRNRRCMDEKSLSEGPACLGELFQKVAAIDPAHYGDLCLGELLLKAAGSGDKVEIVDAVVKVERGLGEKRMAAPKEKVFVVRAKAESLTRFRSAGEVAGETRITARLVRANTLNKVETHVAQDFDIAVATPDELHALGKEGVDIEDAAE